MKEVPNVDESIPVLPMVNLVTPLAEAVNRSPELILLTMSEALLPIPPDIDRGAGVVAEPTNTEESASDVSIKLPVPLGASVKLSFDSVPIVAALPAPRFRVVADIPRVAADVIVARFPAVIVVRPEAARVVSDASSVSMLSPELRVRVDPVD